MLTCLCFSPQIGSECHLVPCVVPIIWTTWLWLSCSCPCTLDHIMIYFPLNPHRSDDYTNATRSSHFGISFALHIEVPILVSKITCIDFCRCPLFFASSTGRKNESELWQWGGSHAGNTYLPSHAPIVWRCARNFPLMVRLTYTMKRRISLIILLQ